MTDDSGKQIGDAELGLHRYEGRYLVDDYWDDDDKHISRFFDVLIADDHLAVQEQSRNHRHGEEPPDEAYALAAASEHTFDAVGHPHRIRFVIDDSDVAQSIIVIRDGCRQTPVRVSSRDHRKSQVGVNAARLLTLGTRSCVY